MRTKASLDFHMQLILLDHFRFLFFTQTQIQLHYNSRTHIQAMWMESRRRKGKWRKERKRDRHLKWNSESSTLIKWSGATWITTRRTTKKNKRKGKSFNLKPFAMCGWFVRIDTEFILFMFYATRFIENVILHMNFEPFSYAACYSKRTNTETRTRAKESN